MAKNKGEMVEKYLNQIEKEMFHQAKVKELRNFFECGVWEFSTVAFGSLALQKKLHQREYLLAGSF